MSLFCCASFYSGFQQLCRGVDMSVTDLFCEKGVPSVGALQSSGCPTLSLSRGHLPAASPQEMDGAVPGFLSQRGDSGMCELRHVRQCSDVTARSQLWLPLASAWGSEGTQRLVPQLPRLSPRQPQHKSHFKELRIHFSELKACFYFHVTSLKVFFFCGKKLNGNSSWVL